MRLMRKEREQEGSNTGERFGEKVRHAFNAEK